MIKEYLEQEGAIGVANAIPTQTITEVLHMCPRKLVALVANERKEGALICSTQKRKGGYYMPANGFEILEQKARLEKGFAKRANAVKPFRNWAKVHKE